MSCYSVSPSLALFTVPRSVTPEPLLLPHGTLPPLTPVFLSSFTLEDERPPLLDIIDLCDDDDEDNLLDPYIPPALTSPAPLLRPCSPSLPPIDLFDSSDNTPSLYYPPPLPTNLVADTKRLDEGVNTSTAPVPAASTPRYPSLFLCRALERPKGPDTVQPAVPQPEKPTTMGNCEKPQKVPRIKEEDMTHHAAIVPPDTPLYEHACKKREAGYGGDDENPRK
ncbi:hypothetical protein EDB92DRAFT_1820893 [Lactarius akahatsu]|uniref:Uncharacterized protein n=1 Tax=Lactarius akahatsu TaxID=416441 RepID=A0AAD4LB18_9AGAM|nr:hypothetical protein EDB92DRAFT_1820893 [Lactarius akahatsu]